MYWFMNSQKNTIFQLILTPYFFDMNFQSSTNLNSRVCTFFFLLFIVEYGYSQEKTVSKMQVLNGITSVKNTDQRQTKNWIDFKHPEGAFTIKMPGKATEVKKE